MKSCIKKTILVAIMFCMLAIPLIQSSQATSTEATAKAQFQSFLTSIAGVDLAKYNVTSSGYGISYPSNLGENVKEETVSYSFDSGQSQADAWCIFDNGIMTSCSYTPTKGPISYAQTPSANAVDQAETIIQKYTDFALQHYTIDTAYLQQAQSILHEANSQKAATMTNSNMKVEISLSVNYSSIRWTYTENGLDMPFKSIKIDFRNNDFCWFGDSWSLYKTSMTNTLSKDEAVNLGFTTAKNYPVHLAKFDGDTVTSIEMKPDWSNTTNEATLSMLPGTSFNNSLPAIPSAPNATSYPNSSKTVRDALTLYPVWQLVFYFAKPIGSIIGIEVGVWGDTKEIAYCREYGHLGATETTLPSNVQSPNGTQTSFLGSIGTEYIFALFMALSAAIVIASYLVIHKKRRK